MTGPQQEGLPKGRPRPAGETDNCNLETPTHFAQHLKPQMLLEKTKWGEGMWALG